jgi:membrane-associated phospholipid phosphatase
VRATLPVRSEPHFDRGLERPLDEVQRVDDRVYRAIASMHTPRLDDSMTRLSRAADYSRLSIAAAALLAVTGGRDGRRAAILGLAAVGVTAAVANLLVKPLGRRPRPRRTSWIKPGRQVRMPRSASFPSGHTAAAFAFATAVGTVLPQAAKPLRALAALVAYSRVHTGVHYPSDVVAGALLGTVVARGTTQRLEPYMTMNSAEQAHSAEQAQ